MEYGIAKARQGRADAKAGERGLQAARTLKIEKVWKVNEE